MWALKDEKTGELKGYPFTGNIDGTLASKLQWTGNQLFYECGDQCEGGRNFECAMRHAGRMCNACAPGHAKVAGHCVECIDADGGGGWAKLWDVAWTLASIAAVVLVWVSINSMSAGKFDALDIGLVMA